MAYSHTAWILFFCFALNYCAALIYTGKPLVPPGRHPSIHLYREEEPGDVIMPEFAHPPPVKIYPLTPEEMGQLYMTLPKQKHYQKSLKYLKHISGGKLKSHWKMGLGKKYRDNEWVSNGAYGKDQYNKVAKPVFQLGYGYPSNQIQEYRNSNVKPVVEHIEGDLKYDFRTNAHSF